MLQIVSCRKAGDVRLVDRITEEQLRSAALHTARGKPRGE